MEGRRWQPSRLESGKGNSFLEWNSRSWLITDSCELWTTRTMSWHTRTGLGNYNRNMFTAGAAYDPLSLTYLQAKIPVCLEYNIRPISTISTFPFRSDFVWTYHIEDKMQTRNFVTYSKFSRKLNDVDFVLIGNSRDRTAEAYGKNNYCCKIHMLQTKLMVKNEISIRLFCIFRNLYCTLIKCGMG